MLLPCLLCAVLCAQDARKAERLAKQGKALEDKTKELWKRFVFEHEKLSDKELATVVKNYERAVDTYQKSLEEKESPGLNSAILTLAKRIAQVRMVQTSRALRNRPPPKQTAPPQPPPERPPREQPTPTPPPPKEEPPEEKQERAPPPQPVGLPELVETKAERRRGLQGLRNFLMHYYFANRKYSALVTRCHLCNGTGRKKTNQLDRRRRIITVACTSCNESGGYLDESAARKGFWLCHSPLYRSDAAQKVDWEATLALWKQDPSKVTEFLKTLRIESIDYHGLWAEAVWTEKATKAGSRHVLTRVVKRKLVRAGKRWFFYDEKFDKDFFGP